MSWTDAFVYEGDYFGLDEWWYKVGGSTAVDAVTNKVETTYQETKDTVTAPFRYIKENSEMISTVGKYAFWAFVILGGLYIIVSIQKLLTAIGIYHDAKRLVSAASGLVK